MGVIIVSQGLVKASIGRLLVAEADSGIGGFTAGTFAPDRSFRTLLVSRWFAFGCVAAGAVIANLSRTGSNAVL